MIEGHEGREDELEATISSLRAQLATAAADADAESGSAAAAVSAELTSLQAEVADLKDQVADSEDQIGALSGQVSTLPALESLIDDLKAELKTEVESSAQLKASKSLEDDSRFADTEAQLADSRSALEESQTESDSLRDLLSQATSGLQSMVDADGSRTEALEGARQASDDALEDAKTLLAAAEAGKGLAEAAASTARRV